MAGMFPVRSRYDFGLWSRIFKQVADCVNG
jgi:hypothetical protein